MIRRRLAARTSRTSSLTGTPAFTDFHEWVLSLPWVVERPYSLGTPGVRTFGIDCEPLDRRQLWLITGLRKPLDVDDVSLAVIVPDDAADAIEDAGWAYRWVPMPAGHILMRADGGAHRPQVIEALAITAYSCAMA
jgi:hypothetical protein